MDNLENVVSENNVNNIAKPLNNENTLNDQGEIIYPASVNRRLVNMLVDSVAIYILSIIFNIVYYIYFDNLIVSIILGILSTFFYYAFFEFLFQKSIGKFFTKTKVVSLNGEKPSFGRILLRSIFRYIPFELLSFLFYGKYPIRGWHDRFSKTLVVPSHLDPEEIKKIDYEKIKATKQDNTVMIIVAIVVGVFLILSVIGILSSVVLVSLSSAREKANEAYVKSATNNLLIQSVLYFDENQTYDGFCDTEEVKNSYVLKSEKGIKETEYVCNDNVSEFAVSAKIKEGSYFCVDSNVEGGVLLNSQITNQTSCNQPSSNTETVGVMSDDEEARQLNAMAEYLTSHLNVPSMVDDETRIDKVYVGDDLKLNFAYTIVNYSSGDINWSDFEPQIYKELKQTYCFDPSMKIYVDENINIVWNYNDKNGSLIGSIDLSPRDCK